MLPALFWEMGDADRIISVMITETLTVSVFRRTRLRLHINEVVVCRDGLVLVSKPGSSIHKNQLLCLVELGRTIP